jgi:hypothetical protein
MAISHGLMIWKYDNERLDPNVLEGAEDAREK